jgi:hypothetical protein
MPKPYSLDLRERVVRFVDGGHSRHATAAEQDRSPNAQAPRFVDLAAASGMTNAALLVALTTPHAGMPMFTFNGHRQLEPTSSRRKPLFLRGEVSQ